ncbi:MAG: hypothetical protein RL391_1648 [Actinomycetota bacterium]|jgi:hypothetical protein
MDDLGFILASYAVTLVGVGSFAWSIVRRSRRMAKQVPPEDRPWT